jgi:hypothetical protein
MFEFRYSQLINSVWVTMMYSTGIPVLYLATAFSFFLTYWFDKLLFTRFYKSPPLYSMEMAK